MLKKIEAAYNDYFEKYKRKPDYIVVNHQLFDDLMIESFENSNPVLMGMHPLVISDKTSDFHLYEKWELDFVLADYEKNNPKMEPYSVLRLIPFGIVRINLDSNEKIPHKSVGDLIEIDYKAIQAYQRHLAIMKQGKADNW